jgi:putative transposase
MARPLSMDLRERAIARLEAGESVRAVARALSVSPSSVVKWWGRYRRTGSVAPGKVGGHVPPKIAGAQRDWLVERTRSAPFTLRGLVAERGLTVDYRTVWKFAHAEGLSFKKNSAGQRAGSPGRGAQA